MPRPYLTAWYVAAMTALSPPGMAWAAGTVSLPRTPATAPLTGQRNYVLGPGDRIAVHVTGPDSLLDYDLLVNTQGTVYVPRLGEVLAEGLTPFQLQQNLQRLVVTRAPGHQVVVMLAEARVINVFVYGQVRQPGPVVYRHGARLSDYLNAAGGPTPQAWLQSVKVTKAGDGKRSTVTEANADLILFQGRYDLDPVLGPNDVVYVPEAFFSLQNFRELLALVLGGAGLIGLLSGFFHSP